MAIAATPTPPCPKAVAPRRSVSNAARAAATWEDHSSTAAGFPFNAERDCATSEVLRSENSGAGNGSYNHVELGGDAAGGSDAGGGPADRGAKGSDLTSPPSTIRKRVFIGTSVNTCVPPEGHSTVSLKMR